MFESWFAKHYFMYILSGICATGLLIKLITNLVYGRLVYASGNMSASKNKLVRLMKLKFETFYKLRIGVNNVDIFVDKYVYKHKFCGLLLSTWENLSGLMLIACLLIAPVATVLGIIVKCGESEILYTFFTGVCTSSILILVDNLFNIQAKKRLIKINMKDYLENFLKARLEQEAINPGILEKYRTELSSRSGEELSPRLMKKAEKRIAKEKKEQEKLYTIEVKQKEREERKKEKFEAKQAANAQREAEKLRLEEERRLAEQERVKLRRLALEEKMEKQRQKLEEKQFFTDQVRMQENEKSALKREENEKKLNLQAKRLEEEKNKEVKEKQESNELLLKNVHSNDCTEIAATKENKKKTSKQAKIKERNERLKEEIQAQRELRNKQMMEGVDPFEACNGTKKVEKPSQYKVNDFNLEYEMRIKAAQRKEKQRLEEECAVSNSNTDQKKPTYTVEADTSIKGKSPYEDKVIEDFLKEFLA